MSLPFDGQSIYKHTEYLFPFLSSSTFPLSFPFKKYVCIYTCIYVTMYILTLLLYTRHDQRLLAL